ncbi:hypothetical protein FB45DRAFT_108156 [Roridomyces roridus]|uniref:Uncharacterized protein n=1 Tax=Roridomyces roridus TaxID=1738132 RepID=A0AAD7BK40_9AGAR|nr:hypothetical protein FB45DRAFT_108156 [Roridomyces roridus]
MLRLARNFLTYTTGAGAVGFGGFLLFTRKSHFVPFNLDNDPLYNSTLFQRLNPNENRPILHDLCVRRVPLTQIRPELLKEEGKLAEAFCAGIWSGIGYDVQRKILEKKHRGPETAHQLWDRPELAASTYPVGTEITDHFEVVSHTSTSIVLRAGDCPRNSGPRDADGLFEMSAVVDESKQVAEFALKCIFFHSEGTNNSERMPEPVAFLHRLYTKLWMETGLKNQVLK